VKQSLTFFGDPGVISGTYLLHLQNEKDVWVKYGRFRRGELISTPAGQYLYIGSALAREGGASLPRRLLRHATRSAGPPHSIRQHLIEYFAMKPPASKRLHWHVDYLLEETAVNIYHITLIQDRRRLEGIIAQNLNRHPAALPLATGLGATDDPGLTHILYLQNLTIPQIHQLLSL